MEEGLLWKDTLQMKGKPKRSLVLINRRPSIHDMSQFEKVSPFQDQSKCVHHFLVYHRFIEEREQERLIEEQEHLRLAAFMFE